MHSLLLGALSSVADDVLMFDINALPGLSYECGHGGGYTYQNVL